MKTLLIINFDELEQRYKTEVFRPLNEYFQFSDLFPLFLHDDTERCNKVAVWEYMETNHEELIYNSHVFNYHAFDLVLDIFYELLLLHIKAMIGLSLDDFDHQVINIVGNTVYIEVSNEKPSRIHHSRYKANYY